MRNSKLLTFTKCVYLALPIFKYCYVIIYLRTADIGNIYEIMCHMMPSRRSRRAVVNSHIVLILHARRTFCNRIRAKHQRQTASVTKDTFKSVVLYGEVTTSLKYDSSFPQTSSFYQNGYFRSSSCVPLPLLNVATLSIFVNNSFIPADRIKRFPKSIAFTGGNGHEYGMAKVETKPC